MKSNIVTTDNVDSIFGDGAIPFDYWVKNNQDGGGAPIRPNPKGLEDACKGKKKKKKKKYQ